MKYLIKRFKDIPKYGWICGIVYFVLQYSMYRLANLLANVFGTTAWAVCPKVPVIDDAIPLIPIFAVIYLFSYVFWIMGPPIASLTAKKNFVNYMIGLSAAYIIGFLIFVLLPTYMDRSVEGLMEFANQPGFGAFMLRVIYGADGGDRAFNLFPSYHCLISIYCYLAIRKRQEVSRGVRIYSLVMAILISISTVTTKQHYFLDIIGGIGISLICYWVVQKLDPAKRWVKE